jgi:4-hydroxy-tetrahydrodipicolinate synthase
MVTPFRDDLSLDLDEAQRLARWLVDHGSDGLVVSGSTGESPTLTHDEKIALFRAVKDAVGTNATVIAGTGTYSTADSIDLTREAEKAGVDGVLVVTPYYNRPPQRGLLEHFKAVADSSELPVMIYDIPVRTTLKIEVPVLLELAAHPNIVAVKDATNDLGAAAKLMADAPSGFELYSGNDDQTLSYQPLGAAGVISVMSHVMGPRIREQFVAFEAGDVAKAREIQFEVSRVHAALCTNNPIPIKAAVNMLGLKAGRPRPPLVVATAEEEDRVRRALEAVGAL